MCKFKMHVYSSFNLNFGIWPNVSRHTHVLQCSPASLELVQACPNNGGVAYGVSCLNIFCRLGFSAHI